MKKYTKQNSGEEGFLTILWIGLWLIYSAAIVPIIITGSLSLLIIAPLCFLFVLAVIFRLKNYKNKWTAFKIGSIYIPLALVGPILFGHYGEVFKAKINYEYLEEVAIDLASNRIKEAELKKDRLQSLNNFMTALTLPTRIMYNVVDIGLTPFKPMENSESYCSKVLFKRIKHYADSNTEASLKSYKQMKRIQKLQDKTFKDSDGYDRIGKYIPLSEGTQGIMQDIAMEKESVLQLIWGSRECKDIERILTARAR